MSPDAARALRPSLKAARFEESVIREMTRLFLDRQRRRPDLPAVNLAQGFPDFAAPEAMKEAACRAIMGDVNQYAVTWGAPALREAIAENTARFYGVRPDPATEITVTCGATEAMLAALLAVTDPGDEVIVFEPFYENYGPDAVLSGATPRFVTLHAPEWTFDPDELAAAFNDRTRAIIVNTPHNPTGKVFGRAELEQIAALCERWDVAVLTDEIYEHLTYDGERHVRPADVPGLRERTITISGLSKTFSATGWRIGWLIAPPEATSAIRKVHDFLTVGAAAPLQEAAAVALGFSDDYFAQLAHTYRAKRDFLLPVLSGAGFAPVGTPRGAYYIMTDARALLDATGLPDDAALARWLIEHAGVATVPGSSFFRRETPDGKRLIRFCYCKKDETLERAAELLAALPSRA